MTFSLVLLVAGVALAAAGRRTGRWGLPVVVVLLLAALVHDVAPVVDLDAMADVLDDLALPGLAALSPTARLLLVATLVWCGPAADLVVRRALHATGLPAPEAAGAAGLRAGRWIGRLERWLLVACVVAGQPALAVLPVGGKALMRYAEIVAETRVGQPTLHGPDGSEPPVTRAALVDYVIVGSLASWLQAIGLALLVGTP